MKFEDKFDKRKFFESKMPASFARKLIEKGRAGYKPATIERLKILIEEGAIFDFPIVYFDEVDNQWAFIDGRHRAFVSPDYLEFLPVKVPRYYTAKWQKFWEQKSYMIELIDVDEEFLKELKEIK
jgi:hypothetical protein